MTDILNVIKSIFSVLSVGQIISTILTIRLNRKITSLDKQIFNYYTYIYFSGVNDGLGNNLSKKQSSDFFEQLSNDLIKNPKKSILLSNVIIGLLNEYIKNNSDDNLNKLKKRIDKEYLKLKKKNGYPCSNILEKIIYVIYIIEAIFVFIFCISAILATIESMSINGFFSDDTSLLFAITFILISWFILLFLYLYENKSDFY